ncbi:ATP-dependent DNA helicase II subunit 2 [Trebouxia sp. C0009 RCD-2024]
MARNKEVAVVLLDVGPLMNPIREFAGKAICGFLQSKMLNKPTHEVELVYYGTTESDNPLNDELGEDQYMNITIEQELNFPDTSFLASVLSVAQGSGSSDFMDALTVAVDKLHRAVNDRPDLGKANITKRVVLVSNFLDAAKEDPDDQFGSVLVDRMQDKNIRMEVISVDVPQYDSQFAAAKKSNFQLLNRILGGVTHTLRHVSDPLDLLGAFKAKEYSATAYYSGPFRIADTMTIKVKVTKKSSHEKFPSTAKYSDRSRAADASHTVSLDTEFRCISNPDEVVAPEDRVKAYKVLLFGWLQSLYGKQTVPISAEEENHLKYLPEKDMQVIGFVALDQDTWLMAPEKENPRAHMAMSALARALDKTKKACIIRFVPRANQAVFVGCATPLLGDKDKPDCLVLNYLPFTEDVRSYKFTSFAAKEELSPSQSQLQAAERLVDALDLTQDGAEHLQPETTANPALHRFFAFMAARAVDPDARLPAQDLQVQHTLSCPFGHTSAAQAALDQLPQQFSVKQQAASDFGAEEGAAAAPQLLENPQVEFKVGEAISTRVENVSTQSPVDDFKALVQQGQTDEAVEGLQKAVHTLVDTSLGDRFYNKAFGCIPALREACIEHKKGTVFNMFLEQMASKYEHDQLRADFWKRVMEAKISLISDDELADVGVSRQESEAFVKQHTPGQQAETQAAAPMDVEEEDEFAGIE